jgi:hypothetical protein
MESIALLLAVPAMSDGRDHFCDGRSQKKICRALSSLFYRDLSAYGSIPDSSFHPRRMPNSERLYCHIRQILSVQHRHSILLKGA